MRRYSSRCRGDPILAPDQFGIAWPLRPKDLDRRVTRQGSYPSLPPSIGIPWSEYVEIQRNRPTSVSSSTEAPESDHARYITRRIVRHARSMVTGTRSLPTDSPEPNFQPIERGYLSEGSQENVYATPSKEPLKHTSNKGGTEITETDRVSTFTGLDDYDALFTAKYGRGALDPVPFVGDQMLPTPLGAPTPHPVEHMMSAHDEVEKDGSQIPPPSSTIIGEGAAMFMDMTETILDTLDRQVKTSTNTHLDKESLPQEEQRERTQKEKPQVLTQTAVYPDLFLPVRENYRISDRFHGYSDHMSTDNNPMVLVELNNFSIQYGTSIYAVDRINGIMYGKFDIGYRMIPEKATIIPQYQSTSMETEYPQTYENTLPRITTIAAPIAQSTPVTQASSIPMAGTSTGRDIVQPISSEEARAKYLEEQMKGVSGMRLPMKSSLLEEESLTSMDLTRKIDLFCREQKEKRRLERETHQMILDAFAQVLWPVFIYWDAEVMFHLWYECDAVVYNTNMLFLFLGYILACDSYFDNYI